MLCYALSMKKNYFHNHNEPHMHDILFISL